MATVNIGLVVASDPVADGARRLGTCLVHIGDDDAVDDVGAIRLAHPELEVVGIVELLPLDHHHRAPVGGDVPLGMKAVPRSCRIR